MLHLDPARTNRSPFVGPADPVVAWRLDCGAPIEAAPAFLADGTAVVATLGGKLVGVSASGERLFAADLRDRAYASPLVHADSIFAGSDDGHLVAFSPKGAVRWRLDVEGEVDTAPVPAPWGAVVLAAGPTVLAVRTNGTVLWRVKAKRKVYGAAAIAGDGTVWVGSQDNRLYAVTPDGKVRHAIDLGGDVDAAPAVGDDGTVYAGHDGGGVAAVDPARGAIKWRARLDGHVRGSLTLTRNRGVVAGTYGPSPRVVALDAASGEPRWSFAVPGTGAAEFGVHGSPVEDAQGNLYFGAQDDAVYSLAPDGTLRWKVATGADVDAPVVIAREGVVYAASDDGALYCIRDRALGP
jgi:outer membrane protein assembly factor BamB